jgi:hypothetical protein
VIEMHQYGQLSVFYSITIVLIGMLFLIFSLISVGLVSFPAFLGVLFTIYGSFAFIGTKRSASRSKQSND